jgi:hypothetical protein
VGYVYIENLAVGEMEKARKVARARLTYLRNRGELSEGWYDPSTLQKAVQSAAEPESRSPGGERPRATATVTKSRESRASVREELEESDSNEEIGPTLPGQEGRSRGGRVGPSIPRMQDLELKKGMMF